MEKYANATKRVTVFVDSPHLCEYIYLANKPVFGIHHPLPMKASFYHRTNRVELRQVQRPQPVQLKCCSGSNEVASRPGTHEMKPNGGSSTKLNLHSSTVLNGKSMAAEQRNCTKLNLQATKERTQQLSDLNYNKIFCSGPPKAPKPQSE